ncbi:MAG: hypothetical protein J6S21_06515, partial [Victivallales bacterium]|nr:hypothetical protein [Victivallales bacterium]
MIEQMKKITVVCLAGRKEQSLQVLQKLASVHILPAAPPASGKMDVLKRKIARIDALLMQLESFAGKTLPENESAMECGDVLEKAFAAGDALKHSEERLPMVQQAMDKLAPWGDLTMEVPERLAKLGWKMALCSCDRREMPELPEDAVVHTVAQDGPNLCFAVFSREDLSTWKLPVV